MIVTVNQPIHTVSMARLQELLAMNIKLARARMGFSQMRLAELCDLSTSFIGEIELGKKFPSAKNLERLSESLGLKPYQLFYEDEDWEVHDKYDRLASLYHELKEKMNDLLEETVRKYLRD
jgi:transcriptional regulator with XRE-family HTH domain